MKKLLFPLFAFCLLLSLTACEDGKPADGAVTTNTAPTTTAVGNLTVDQAKQIALAHAKVTADAVFDVETEYDVDDGVPSYEIHFKANSVEYEYDIHAETGAVIRVESEPTDDVPSAQGETYIGAANAKTLAFNHAGVSADSVYDLEIDLDEDERVPTYEIEFKSGNREYTYDIEAITGVILRHHNERDD